MSNGKKCQTCHFKEIDGLTIAENKRLTGIIVDEFRRHNRRNAAKRMANDLGISTDSVKNWFYKGKGINAIQLLFIMKKYEYIHVLIENMLKQ